MGFGHAWRTLGVKPEGHCQHCGKEIVMWRADRKYCTDACGDKARKNQKPTAARRCKGCRAEFVPVKRQEYCTKDCRNRHYESRHERRNRQRKPKIEVLANQVLMRKWG